jgi:hypothetical protein
LFTGEAKHGFTEGACKIVENGQPCNSSDVCVLKISNPNQGTVADCRDDVDLPYKNMFQNRICCTPTEYCRDGIDNTGDGLVDCASPDCHANTEVGTVPQRCDAPLGVGNNQNTSECVDEENSEPGNVVFRAHCLGPREDDVGFTINSWPTGFHTSYDYPDVSWSYYCNYGETDNPADEPIGYCSSRTMV